FVDTAARHRGAESEALPGVEGQFVDLGDVLDVHDEAGVAGALAELHDDVGAAGEDAGAVAPVGEQADGLGDGGGGGVINGFHRKTSRIHQQLTPGYARSGGRRLGWGSLALVIEHTRAHEPGDLVVKGAEHDLDDPPVADEDAV